MALEGQISTERRVLNGEIARDTKGFTGEIPGTLVLHYTSDAEEYTGPYEVTPKVEAQTLPTKGKLMRSDVEVQKIPYFETSNTAGGSTVYIAKEMT